MRLSTLFTFIGFLGSVIAPIRAWQRLKNQDKTGVVPSVMQTVLLLALLNSSMSFFLFSFQVHEKTILLPLLPLTLLLSIAPNDSATFKLGVLANNVGVFRFVSTYWELVTILMLKTRCSMWPLLRKEGLSTQYIALTLLWNRLVGHDPFVAMSHATYLDILTWVRSFYTHCRLEFIGTSS